MICKNDKSFCIGPTYFVSSCSADGDNNSILNVWDKESFCYKFTVLLCRNNSLHCENNAILYKGTHVFVLIIKVQRKHHH